MILPFFFSRHLDEEQERNLSLSFSLSVSASLSLGTQEQKMLKPNAHFSFFSLYIYTYNAYVSSPHRLVSTYHSSHWATCQSHVVYIKISQLQYTIHVLHNSNLAYATPVANTSLARCLFGLPHIFGQTGATPVALTSTRPLYIT